MSSSFFLVLVAFVLLVIAVLAATKLAKDLSKTLKGAGNAVKQARRIVQLLIWELTSCKAPLVVDALGTILLFALSLATMAHWLISGTNSLTYVPWLFSLVTAVMTILVGWLSIWAARHFFGLPVDSSDSKSE